MSSQFTTAVHDGARGGAGSHRTDIEGLRGLSILLVVGFHIGVDRLLLRFGIDGLQGGFVGVDVFYVISGYLITSLLLRELESTGSIDLRTFYARRIRRLLPLAALVGLATYIVVLLVLPSLEWGRVARDAISSGLYVANWNFAAQATDYMSHAEVSPYLHYWSLSVEEQFYVLWPMILLIGAAGAVRLRDPSGTRLVRRRALAVIVVLVAVSFAASVVLTPATGPWAFFGIHTRAWELGIGAVIAASGLGLRGKWSALAAATGVGLVVIAAVTYGPETPYPGVAAAAPVLGAALIICAGTGAGGGEGNAVSRALAWAPMAFLGRISYAWYLWHWPAVVLAGPIAGVGGRPSAQVLAVAVLASLALATTTHYAVENPLRRSDVLLRPWAPAATVLTTIAALVLVAIPGLLMAPASSQLDASEPRWARVDAPSLDPTCVADFGETEAEACEFGDPEGPLHLVLVGDSHAGHLVPALEVVAKREGWRGEVYTKASCPGVDVRRWLGAYRREYHECPAWRANVLRSVNLDAPPYLVVARFSGYADTLVDEQGERVEGSEALQVWKRGVERTLDRLKSAGTTVVFLGDVPNPGFDVPACLEKAQESTSCGFERGEAISEDQALSAVEIDVVAQDPSAEHVHVFPLVCPEARCSVVDQDGLIKYRDQNHLTASFSRRLGERLWDAISTRGAVNGDLRVDRRGCPASVDRRGVVVQAPCAAGQTGGPQL